ncbi:MAG: hypothetical protein HOW73_46755, partial [Polyangiaceae bacterium]|nr:hypothetical protein [Polyangiaceae bacterium]
WKIEADGGGSGLGFTLPKQPLVQGVALDPTGAPLASAPLLFSPAQPQDSSYAAIVRSKPDPSRPIFWPTRPQSGLTSDFGDFELPVDPGQMNVVVQMAPESGFPWAVIPNLLIDTADVTPVMDLGELSVRYPALAQGLISNDTGPVSYAVVRAWIQPKQGDSVGPLVQIGATSTDEAGVFVLPLPPSITLPAEDATPAEP